MKPIGKILNNDNERLKHSFNINDIEERNPYYVDQTANWLEEQLGSRSSHAYYCKIARLIPKHALNNMLINAKTNGKDPARLFTYLAQKYLKNARRK